MRVLFNLFICVSVALSMGQGCLPASPPPDDNPPVNNPPDDTPPPDNTPPPNTPAALPDGIIAVHAAATGANNGSSWTDAYTDLQDALSAASADGSTIQQIWVAKGTYKPTEPGGSNGKLFRLINDVSIYGGFAGVEGHLIDRDIVANPTVLSGDLNGDDGPNFVNIGDNTITVVAASQLMATAILDGFTVKAGNASFGGGLRVLGGSATIRNCTFTTNRATQGGGVRILGPATPVFIGCTFRGNQATSFGGGALVSNGADPQLIACTFIQNISDTEAGAIRFIDGTGRLTNCIFKDNTALFGGAISSSAQNLELTNCMFEDNSSTLDSSAAVFQGGGAIYSIGGPLNANNCIFRKNNAGTLGGAIHSLVNSYLYGCLFDRNSAYEGGAAYFDSDFVNIPDCTFSANTADNVAGGVTLAKNSYLQLFNTILWANSDATGMGEGAQITFLAGLTNTTVRYCNIQGLTPALAATGINNIASNPLFVDASNGDLHLLVGSPCIGKGDNGYVADGLTTDLDGNPRIQGTPPIVDMGAYEQ